MIQIVCIGWILGICLMGRKFNIFPELSLFGFILSSIILIGLISIYSRLTRLSLRIFSILIAFIITVFLGQNYAQQELLERLKQKIIKPDDVEVIVFIDKINRLNIASNLEKQQQPVQVLSVSEQPVTWVAMLKNDDSSVLRIGEYYRLAGQVYPVHSYATTGAFDVEKWYLQNNWMANFRVNTFETLTPEQVVALGYGSTVREHQTFIPKFQRWIEQKRLDIRHFIQQQPIEHQGLSLALLTGDQSLLSPELKYQFQRMGMSHLLAISGPHVLILATMLCWILSRLIRYKAMHQNFI